MGIDTRATRRNKYDRCLYYKAKYVNNMKLIKDAVASGVFYAEGVQDDTSTAVQNGNAQSKQIISSMITYDVVDDLEVNDYVYAGGDLNRVTSIVRKGMGKSEQFNRRPIIETTLELIR